MRVSGGGGGGGKLLAEAVAAAASSVVFDDIDAYGYDSFLLTVGGGLLSTTNDFKMLFRAAAVDITANYECIDTRASAAGAFSSGGSTGAAAMKLGSLHSASKGTFSVNIFNLTNGTTPSISGVGQYGTFQAFAGVYTGGLTVTGFKLAGWSGETITGTFRLYGVGQS